MLRLLNSPEVSGGIVAAVPSVSSRVVVEELKKGGYTDAVVVGEVKISYGDEEDKEKPLLFINSSSSSSSRE